MGYIHFDLNNGEADSFDCGLLGTMILKNFDSSVRGFTFGGSGVLVKSGEMLVLPCTGETIIQATACNPGTCYATGMDRDLPVSQFLMGGAGLICGLLIAWAFMKSL